MLLLVLKAQQSKKKTRFATIDERFRASPAAEVRRASLFALRTALLRAEAVGDLYDIQLHLAATVETDTSNDVRAAAAGIIAAFFS